jgi:PEGA domain
LKPHSPSSVFRTLAATVLTVAVCASIARAQAAAEYTLGASKAATSAAGVGNAMNRSVSKATGKLSDNLKSQVRESPKQVMKENREKFEKEAAEGGGALRFTSEPSDAAVFIDGRLVARTPAEVKVPEGRHSIRMTRPDRDKWTEQVTLGKGQDLDVSAKLVNTNPSVITLSFADPEKK